MNHGSLGAADAAFFESRRRGLFWLAYRMLGTHADAEDAVQETFVKWLHADRAAIQTPAAWLTSACTNLCVDMLRAAYRSRVDYVGAWLPEPIHTPADGTPETEVELASSLSTAFLLLLERLTPKERAAYLLREIFDMPYAQIAVTLGMSESACRKLVSRAGAAVGQPQARHTLPAERQASLLSAFQAAIQNADASALAHMLADDVRLAADGGGQTTAVRRELTGKQEVMRFIERGLFRFWRGHEWRHVPLNGGHGALLYEAGNITASLSFAFDENGTLTHIYIVRNPAKLARLQSSFYAGARRH